MSSVLAESETRGATSGTVVRATIVDPQRALTRECG